MRPTLLAAVRCLCLVVGAAAVALWVRSYRAGDALQWPLKSSPWMRSVGTEPGRLVFQQSLVFL